LLQWSNQAVSDIFITVLWLFISPPIAAAAGAEPIKIAEQTRFYSPDGKSLGTVTSESQGSVRYRDSTGKTIGTSTTDSTGTTRYYDAQGRSLGTSTGPARAPFPERR
jgi:streptogramin lyase